MWQSVRSTVGFFAHVVRDLAGTLRGRWRRFHERATAGGQRAVVAVDVFPLLEHMTGVGWYEWNLLRALDLRDDGLEYNLYAHTFLAADDSATPQVPGSRHLRMRLHRLPECFLLPVRPSLFLLRRVIEPILRVLDGNDVLFAPNFFMHRTQLPFGRTAVATVHDLAFATMPEAVAQATLRDLRQHLPATVFRSERLIAVSESTAEDLVEHLGISRRRVHTIHEGLDPLFGVASEGEDLELDERLPERYLLFVSTIEPRKNVAGILRAFNLLVEWGYPGQLVMVGRWGWRTDGIRRELAGMAARSRVVQLDDVQRADLPGIYRRAEALLFPSWIEGFGLPLLEAMACGTPVVTSGQSAMPEVAGPAAVYVDPANPHGIASAVASLISDPQHRERLIAIGRKRAARFSWDLAAAATAQALRQAAGVSSTGNDQYRV